MSTPTRGSCDNDRNASAISAALPATLQAVRLTTEVHGLRAMPVLELATVLSWSLILGISVRHFLFPPTGAPQRLSQRLVDGLVYGSDTMPQFSDSQQRVLTVMLENAEGKPTQISYYDASIWWFDGQGSIVDGLQHSLRAALDRLPFLHRGDHTDKVVSIAPEISKRRLEAKYRWKPTPADLDAVASDIWPKKRTDQLGALAGTAPRKSPLTHEGRRALDEASEPFWRIFAAIDGLREPGLKGFISAAKDLGDPDYQPLYQAIAAIAERRLEILRRRRKNKGTWYAFVDITRWDHANRSGEVIATFHVECQSRKEAVVAARRLLAEHATKFDDDMTVEAGIETDIEWTNSSRDSTPS